MEELQGPFVRRRLLPREVTGEQQDALMDTIEWRYNICMLHYCLQRDEEGEEHRYSVFDSAWLMGAVSGIASCASVCVDEELSSRG